AHAAMATAAMNFFTVTPRSSSIDPGCAVVPREGAVGFIKAVGVRQPARRQAYQTKNNGRASRHRMAGRCNVWKETWSPRSNGLTARRIDKNQIRQIVSP